MTFFSSLPKSGFLWIIWLAVGGDSAAGAADLPNGGDSPTGAEIFVGSCGRIAQHSASSNY